MNTQNKIQLIRKQEILAKLHISKSTLYNRIRFGIFPPQISLGGRAVGWISQEVDQVLIAWVNGHSNEDIRKLVSDLISNRKSLY